jgi:hypothetical protein
MQARFTSPDEFSGGPIELFDFTGVAAENPTFYADLTHPQSLNKYQYAYNNPLTYIDPDGHQQAIYQRFMLERAPQNQTVKKVAETVDAANGISKGVTKEIANTGIGMYNGGAMALGKPCMAPYEPDNKWEEFGMNATNHTLLLSALLGSKATIGGVAAADAEETTIVASETANAARQTKQGGAITQPNPAPTGTIVKENGVTIQRYTRDHAPAHLHVQGRGPNTRIGQNGRPLNNNPALSATQRQVVQNNQRTIRRTVGQVMKEHRYNEK